MLSTEHPYSKELGNPAERAAKAILASRGSAPRLFRNTLVFLTVDLARSQQDLDEAVRRFLAWESIVAEREALNLSPHQVKQAEGQRDTAQAIVKARLPEAYQWLLAPEQIAPDAAVQWQAYRLTGQDPLAARATKRLDRDELLLTKLAGTELRRQLDRIPLWRGDHVAIRQLGEDFARYLYLPRLLDGGVLRESIEDGLKLLTWESESFAYADSYDEIAGRYRGLRAGQRVAVIDGGPGVLVRPEPARR